MARSRDVPSKKPSWSLFAAKKASENVAANVSGADAKKASGSKRKDPPADAAAEQKSSAKKSAKTDKVVEKKTEKRVEEKKRKKRRFKSAVVSKREINKAQKHGNSGFAAQPTDRLIREIAGELGFEASRFEPRAIRALIEATEQFATDYLRLTDVLCAHAKRITLSEADSHLASTLLLGNHLFQEENGSAKARLGLLRAMRRDSLSVKNDEKLVPSRDRPRDDADATDDAPVDDTPEPTETKEDDAGTDDDAE